MEDNINFGHPDLNDLLSDKDQDIFNPNQLLIAPSDYLSMEEFQDVSKFPSLNSNFSLLSLNVCSLSSKYDKIKILLANIPFNFSIIGFQEIWSVSREFPILGYQPLVYNTRDMHQVSRNANCVGGLVSMSKQVSHIHFWN